MRRSLLTMLMMVALVAASCVSPSREAYGKDRVVAKVYVQEKAGISTPKYPLTFGHVFRKGAATGLVTVKTGTTVPSSQQCDVKTTWPDGSIRFAVISAVVPIEANKKLELQLVSGGVDRSAQAQSKEQILAGEVGSRITFANLSGSGYSGTRTADLRAALGNQSTPRYWLKGPACTEILVDQRVNNSLNATWEVRVYPDTPYVRISNTVENVEANYRGSVTYTVSVEQGNNTLSQVYGPKRITHLKNSRWRKVFWVGQAPPEVEIQYQRDYLSSTGHLMPYDTSIVVPETARSAMVSAWKTRDTDIFGATYTGGSWMSGLANMRFPNTGGRPEIGMLPKWATMYLLTWDNRLREITLRQAELLANAPVHWREFNPAKSFNGRIINIDDRPKVRIDSEANAVSTNYDPLPPAIGSTDLGHWEVDRSHQGSFAYVPYLISGEYFYLQELYYWAGWNLAQSHWDPSWGRNYSKGLILDQIRGVAWALRNVADAAVIAPDGDPEKTYLTNKVLNNISYRASTVTQYALRYMSNSEGAASGQVSTVTKVTSPWMEDFCLLSFVHLKQLGFDTGQVLDEYSKFLLGRFSDTGFNPYNGAPYRFPTVTSTSGEVKSWAEANSLYSAQPTVFPSNDYAYSYNYIALAALSQLANYSDPPTSYYQQANNLYKWLTSNIRPAISPSLAEDPTWALIPLTPPPKAPAGASGS